MRRLAYQNLQRTAHRDYIDEVFGDGGVLAQRFDGYRPRPGQIQLARMIDACVREQAHALVEGPTGTGKSLAACVPAAYHASQGIKTLYVTANIALQEQVVGKDLPLLQELLPWPFEFALLKGRGNYLCLDGLDALEAGNVKDDVSNHPDAKMIFAWAKTTQTGDVSELERIPDWRVWSETSTTSDQCRGMHCPRHADCWINKAKAKAAQAHIVVANYHLLFADMVVRGATDGGAGVLPPYDVLIADEVHKAGDICRGFIGGRVSRAACRQLVKEGLKALRTDVLSDSVQQAMQITDAEADMLFTRCAVHRKSDRYSVRLRDPNEVDAQGLASALELLAKQYSNQSDRGDLPPQARQSLRNQTRLARMHADTLREADQLGREGWVYYLDDMRGGNVAIASTPVEVGPILSESLWDRLPRAVGMSATLTVGGRFDHASRELGIEDARELAVPTPFDMKRQALLVIPATMPMPNDKAFGDAAAEHVAQVVQLAKGRTLALFTSFRVLEKAHARLSGCGYRVLRQGEAPRTQLLAEFKRDTSSVLLGTASFWEGVDAPGESCSCVVIDRLPFPTPDDPIIDAVAEKDPRGWFTRWSLPRAVIAFRQGFGRLVRSVDDRGCVVLLDRRVVAKSYGATFLRSLGGVPVRHDMREVETFLAHKSAKPD